MSESTNLNAAHLAAFTQSIKETLEASHLTDAELEASAQEASQEKLQAEQAENTPIGIQIRTTRLDPKREIKTDKAKQAQESVLIRKEDADGLADQFSQRQGNREYHLDPHLLSLLAAEELGAGINEASTPDEVINLIRKRMAANGQNPDVAIVDKAFEFLLEVSASQLGKATGEDKERLSKIIQKLEIAKQKHFEANAVEIQVAQKIIGAVDAVVTESNQTVKETLDHFRDIVHNPRTISDLHKFYREKGYHFMMNEFKGLYRYFGGNFAKSNLESPELARLMSVGQDIKAIISPFRQSKIHIPDMESYLKLNGVLKAA